MFRTRVNAGTRQRLFGWRQALFPLIVLALALTACAQPSTGGTAATATPVGSRPTATPAGKTMEAQVAMKSLAFVPEKLTVQAGTTVIWTNEDSFQHTIVSGTRDAPSDLFNATVPGGQTFRFTFDKAGTYDYYCSLHPGMDGVIVVE